MRGEHSHLKLHEISKSRFLTYSSTREFLYQFFFDAFYIKISILQDEEKDKWAK